MWAYVLYKFLTWTFCTHFTTPWCLFITISKPFNECFNGVPLIIITVLSLIIRTVKNNYYCDRLALNRKQINYPCGVFDCIRADIRWSNSWPWRNRARCQCWCLLWRHQDTRSVKQATANLSSVFLSSLSLLKHCPTRGTHTLRYTLNPRTAEGMRTPRFLQP